MSSFTQLLLTFSVICLFLCSPYSSCGTLVDYLKGNKGLSVARDRRATDENISLNSATRVGSVGASYGFLDRNVSLKSVVVVGPVNPTEAVNQIRLNDEIICSTTTISSFVENFKALRNCTVIEGRLIIGPIDFPEKPFEEISFPHLREINDYLLVYRVTGLRTLRNLFPNLAVIRGKQMFKGNSLVIFENPDMEDLGLISLMHIQRGGVWITKNPVLCYLDTLSWKKLLGEEWAKVYHKENRPEDQCVNQCPGNCRTFYSTSHQRERHMCWTTNDCQQVPLPACNAVDQKQCCHSLCMSGCFGGERNECLVCNNVHYSGACYHSCPAFTYEVRGRRCVTEAVCRNFTLDGYARDFKAHEGQCRRECPANFMTDPLDIHRCVPCAGPCPKTCKTATVTTVDTAERLRQCTIINGSLEIQIGKGEQIIATLEQTLQNIEHVTDYIKIIRSHALLSLSFFKRLRFIGGVNTAPGGYALMVIDNQNLQDLFDFTAERPTLQIGNASAKVAFHFNPRLCLGKIDVLMNQISAALNTTYDPRDISTTSNGDRVACDISLLNLIVGERGSEAVILRWGVFEMPDPRSLLGYVLYYRESPVRNLSKYEGREACSGDTWQQMDLPPHDEGDEINYQPLYGLTPARQYGVYVTTYTIASERQGAQSDIIYFTTLSKQPSKPVAVTTESVSSSEIRVYWQPPAEPNGQIVHYNVRWQRLLRFDHRQRLRERDYCQNAIVPSKQYFQASITTTPLPVAGSATCNCNGTKEADAVRIPTGRTPEEHEEYIIMENAIQDLVFVKRSKRDASAVFPAAATTSTMLGFIDSSTASSSNGTESENVTATTELEEDTTVGNSTAQPKPTPATSNETIHQRQITETQYLIKDLVHFTDYVIWVEACHSDEAAQSVGNGNTEPGKFRYPPCSSGANANPSQTLALQGADNIPSESVVANFVQQQTASTSHPVIQISWNDPPAPNGAIIRVDIEYASPERPTPKSECIPRTKPGNELPVYRMDFVGMPSGNYSFRLRASTFAGNGSWTEPVFIIYEQPAGTPSGYSPETVAGIVCGCLMIAVVVGIASFCIWKKHFKKEIPPLPNQVSVNPDYYSYTPDEWEVPRENVELVKELGMGSFGKVFLGIAKNILAGVDRLEVAVKTVNEDKSMSERSFFLQEASIMKEFRCAHVVKLLGVVSEGAPALVIMELMSNGDLKTYLRNQRPDEEHPDRTPPLLSRILQMAGEICDGMAYIHSRKFVHRDLAARNCMMASDLTVKIGDFGMTRDVYETDYYRKGGKGLLPVRWMAPESLKDGLFTNESDVWSFGVVLWEIATLAAQPYQGLSNEQTLKFVIDGNIMEKPEGCHDMLYDIMKKCWQRNAKDRPTFLQIIAELLPHLSDKFREGGDAYFATVDMNEVLRGPTRHDSEVDVPATVDGASPSATPHSPGARVLSIFVKDDVGDGEEEPDSTETDTLLNSRYVEPQIVVQQNGGSTVSSADNSKAMVLTYPNTVANASVTSDGNIGKTLGNGGASQTSLSARTVY